MKKDELERQNREFRRQREKLAGLLSSTQARALGSVRLLEQILQADDTCEEAASEQVARCDEAIEQVLARLARIVDPAAHTQNQADQTVQRLKGQDLHLADALKQYIAGVFEEPLPPALAAGMPTSVEEAILQAMSRIELYTSDPDEERDSSPLTEALDVLRLAMTFVIASSMTTSRDDDVCICGESSCPGHDGGTECLYVAGHAEGTKATGLLESLIEAAEALVANMYEGGEAYDDHEQEETYGQLYPDVRRLNAAIALAKKRSAWYGMPVYQVPYPDGSNRTRAVHSMDEFSTAVLSLCALRFACPQCHDDLRQALERGLASLNDFVGTTVDRLIPEPEESDKLFVFIAFDMGLFRAIPEDYAPENSLAPAAIAYQNLYQHTVGLIETGLDGILYQAARLLAERQRLEEQLTQTNHCDVCGQEPWTWFWDPLAATNALLRIQPEKSKVPVGAFAIGERCKQRLEEGETLSFTSGGQHYRQVGGIFERNGA